MSANGDGNSTCDQCGRNVGGGGVNRCVILTGVRRDLQDGTTPIILHLCLREYDPQTNALVGGCAEQILNGALHDYVRRFGPLDLYDPVEADADARAAGYEPRPAVSA